MDNDTHSGAPSLDGRKLTRRTCSHLEFGLLSERWQMELDNIGDHGQVRTVGILAIEGRYATAVQPAQFLKFFHQHFSAFMNPTRSS